MSAAAISARNTRWDRAQRRHNGHLALLLLSIVGVLALMVAAEQRDAPAGLIARSLVLLPIAIAAANPRDRQSSWLVAALFSTAYLPAGAGESPASGGAVLAWITYTLVLFSYALVANLVATVVHARRTLTGAVRDWESLFSRSSSLDEVALFVMQEAMGITGAEESAILLRNPAGDGWGALHPGQAEVQGDPLAWQAVAEEEAGPTLSLAQWLIHQAEAQVLNGLDGDPRLVGADQAGLRSLLSLPMRQGDGQIFAVLVLGNQRDGSFQQADLEALADLAAASGQALLQAGAFARTDDMLARRKRQLSALQRSARELNASLDPQQIVREALAYAVEIGGGEAGLVSVDLPGVGPVASLHNGSLSAEQLSAVAASAGRFARPLVDVNGDAALPMLQPGHGRRLIVPLRRQGRTLGVIVVECAQLPGTIAHGRAPGQEELRTLATLADYTMAALDNARLFHEMLNEKRKSEQIVRNIADAVFTIDAQGCVTSFNPAACALTGWRAEEALGHRVCDVLSCCADGDGAAPCALLAALSQPTQVFDEHWTIRQRLGSQRVVALSGAPLEQEGRPGGLVVLLHDVTEQSKMEQFQQELIASFSHELRTPLASIGAITQMLLAVDETPHDPETDVHEQLLLLQAQSQRLEDFADRFLTLAQLEQGRLTLEPQPLAVGVLVQALVHQWQAVQQQRVFVVTAPTRPIWAWADEQAVRAVLEILLDNACKYSSCGAPIDVRIALDTPGCVTVAVCDQGPGLAAEDQAHIFERFYRVDNSDARTVYGHGFGLYIARQLVEGMDGQIWVESHLGAGSRFAFSLPLMRWEEADEDPGD